MRLLVIGGGPAGVSAALQGAELGASVTLVETQAGRRHQHQRGTGTDPHAGQGGPAGQGRQVLGDLRPARGGADRRREGGGGQRDPGRGLLARRQTDERLHRGVRGRAGAERRAGAVRRRAHHRGRRRPAVLRRRHRGRGRRPRRAAADPRRRARPDLRGHPRPHRAAGVVGGDRRLGHRLPAGLDPGGFRFQGHRAGVRGSDQTPFRPRCLGRPDRGVRGQGHAGDHRHQGHLDRTQR